MPLYIGTNVPINIDTHKRFSVYIQLFTIFGYKTLKNSEFIYDNVANDRFIKDIFTDIDAIEEADKRAKLKLELIKLFVPRPLNDVEEKDKDIRSAIYNKLSGNSM